MWIQVRSMDSKTPVRVHGLSKLTKIENLKSQLVEIFEAPVDRLRLFYRGKQLEDGYTLFDYNVGLDDLVQVLIRQDFLLKESSNKKSSELDGKPSSSKKTPAESSKNADEKDVESEFYKIGDLVDLRAPDTGAWFEAKITGIKMNKDAEVQPGHKEAGIDDGLLYTLIYDDYVSEGPIICKLKDFRPRARTLLKFEDVKENSMIMINYNVEEPKERGYWYDGKVTKKNQTKTSMELFVTIFIGTEGTPVNDCNILFLDEIIKIEKHKQIECKSKDASSETAITRKKKPKCSFCQDSINKRCKYCACHVCGGKDDPDKQILCDECDYPFHIWCLNPPLGVIPDVDEWYCPSCKNDDTEVVKAGEKLKESKRKSKMASASSSSSRDWGKGMACVGRTKECTIVPPNHFGSIPGVEVGTMWKYRVQVSEYGVHRPHVAGIHGREGEGAYSIVLSGGYEDDVDNGEEFHYTGSGGRDLSGNKRTAEQSSDQKLTRMNRALAINCAAPVNPKTGSEAKDWKAGKPVRVVRNCKGSKHSKYSPKDGNRYDGIYKVVKYWPEKGKSGYNVWRYMLRRDDPVPPPWTKAGEERIQNLGLKMLYPAGYDESIKTGETSGKTIKKKGKRSVAEIPENKKTQDTKKQKPANYELPTDVLKLINEDKNKKLWDECKKFLAEGSQKFLKKVEESFLCICCQEVVSKPVTTECLHNICKSCLVRSFKAKVFCCPMCRSDLGENFTLSINKVLEMILLKLFPGYDAGR